MRPFTYTRPQTAEVALAAWSEDGLYVTGGTNVADYMKLEVLQPRALVDISRLRDPALHRIEIDDNGIRLGAWFAWRRLRITPTSGRAIR